MQRKIPSILKSLVKTPLDSELMKYEELYLDPDVEKNLISKNELLASFGISKAENSALTFAEAHEVYNLLISDPEFDFVVQKIKKNRRITRRDHDKLEFFNVAKTFRKLNQRPFLIDDLTLDFIKGLHFVFT